MPSPKRPRGEGQHLYLIFDDWPWGYSIREISLQPVSSPRKRTSPRLRNSPSSSGSGGKGTTTPRRLPRPVIQIEVPRGDPNFFAAVGTKILVTHRRNTWDAGSVPGGFLPIIDVRSRGVNFGPGEVIQDNPIFFSVGDVLFSMDTLAVRALSLGKLWPPRQENPDSGHIRWSWLVFSSPPFSRIDVASYAVHPDEHTILVSTSTGEEEATFALDTDKIDMVEGEELVWTRLGEWSLPFAGRAHFVHCLDAFVGLSKDPATLGHLCSSSSFDCEAVAAAAAAATDTDSRTPPALKIGREKLFTDNPDETHVGAILVHMGGSDFCLVQCVSIGDGADATDPGELGEIQHKDIAQHKDTLEEDEDLDKLEELQQKDTHEEEGDSTADHEQLVANGGQAHGCRRSYLYRLTIFSLCYDDNGDLTTGETCRMQCYKVPEEITKDYLFLSDPVAFWL